MHDIINRTETTMQQSHYLKVMELAIKAQNSAKLIGNLKQ
jgi:hypothetical protein|tara:strand:+ start:1103 stop:1222 length:120 start_codon:yes stop_codon:yes gene_type:complete